MNTINIRGTVSLVPSYNDTFNGVNTTIKKSTVLSNHIIDKVNKIKQNIYNSIGKQPSYGVYEVNKYNELKYTYNSKPGEIQWAKYVDKIYFIHDKKENNRTLSNLKSVGIQNYTTITYKTSEHFKNLKYYKSWAFIEAVEHAYTHNYKSILILKDDIKFISDLGIITDFLELSVHYAISCLNPNDISNDCLILKRKVIRCIHELYVDKTRDNWHKDMSLYVTTLYKNILKPKADICLHMIDYVFPFVDGNDKEWQKIKSLYVNVKETNSEKNGVIRYRSWDNVLYIPKLVRENCPFVDNIYIIVMSDSLIPKGITDVNIIYHKDFIPEKHLPCFSSTLIETYMTNILDLSEHFLYGNDDTFVINKTHRRLWFSNGTPHLNMGAFIVLNAHFPQNCQRSWNFATLEFNKMKKPYRPVNHDICPMLKSVGTHLHELYPSLIEHSASMIRSDKDLNLYIYPDYIFALTNKENNKYVISKYVGVKNSDSILILKQNLNAHCVCVNDIIENTSEELFLKIKNSINNILFKKYM